MIAGKIKFLPENPPAPLPLQTPAQSLTRVEKPPISKPALLPGAMTSGMPQAFAERTRAALLPLKIMLLQPEGERRNHTVKTVIRWRDAKDEIDVEEMVHRIIDHLKKES